MLYDSSCAVWLVIKLVLYVYTASQMEKSFLTRGKRRGSLSVGLFYEEHSNVNSASPRVINSFALTSMNVKWSFRVMDSFA